MNPPAPPRGIGHFGFLFPKYVLTTRAVTPEFRVRYNIGGKRDNPPLGPPS